MLYLESLTEVFSQVPDPRDPRGIRHPLQGMLALVFLGLLAGSAKWRCCKRWAETHWHQLQEPLGFDRESRRMRRRSVERSLAVNWARSPQRFWLG